MTWEPASSLPKEVIDEFETGIINTGTIVSDKRFGVFQHTLVVTTSSDKDIPPTKRFKVALPSQG